MNVRDLPYLLVKTDLFSTDIPFFSTITNLVNIFEKLAVLPFIKKEKISENYYFTYLKEKNSIECIVLLFPGIGNIIVNKFFNNKIEKLLNQARRYQQGEGTEQDLKRALQIYTFVSEQGYKGKDLADAIFELACRYEIEGKDENNQEKLKQTKKLYEQAADLGNVLAMYNLAVCYENGLYGVEKNPEEALNFLQKAAEAGNIHAMEKLALYLIEDFNCEDAKPYLQKVFEEDSYAMYVIALCYLKGLGGLSPNEKQAISFFKMAANRENTDAMYILAMCYLKGLYHVPRNEEEAMAYLKKADDAGHACAKRYLDYLELEQREASENELAEKPLRS